jgi:hypothetical protein
VADLTAYIVLRRDSKRPPDDKTEMWEVISSAKGATREDAIEAALDGKKVEEEASFEYRAVPLRFWGEAYGAEVKVERKVRVALRNPSAAPARAQAG